MKNFFQFLGSKMTYVRTVLPFGKKKVRSGSEKMLGCESQLGVSNNYKNSLQSILKIAPKRKDQSIQSRLRSPNIPFDEMMQKAYPDQF